MSMRSVMSKNVFNPSNQSMFENNKLNESQKMILDIWNKFIDQIKSNMRSNVRESFKNYLKDIFLKGEEETSKNYETFFRIYSESYLEYFNFIKKIISLYKRNLSLKDLRKELQKLFTEDFKFFLFSEVEIKEEGRENGILIKKDDYQCQTQNKCPKESCLLSEEIPKDKLLEIDQIPLYMQKLSYFFISNENENITFEDIGIRKEITDWLMKIKTGYLSFKENGCLKIYSDQKVQIYLFKEKDEYYFSALISK